MRGVHFNPLLEWSLLELILFFEAVVVLTAVLFGAVGEYIARTTPRDPIVRFLRTFWRVLSGRQGAMLPPEYHPRVMIAGAAADAPAGDPNADPLFDAGAAGPPGMIGGHDELAAMAGANRSVAGAPSPGSSVHGKATVAGHRTMIPDEADPTDDDLASLMAPDADGAPAAAPPPARKPLPVPTAGGVPVNQDATVATGTIQVSVVPFSTADELAGRNGEALRVRVTASPEDGDANRAVVQLIAAALGVQTYQMSLKTGHYKPQKTVEVAGLTQQQVDSWLSRVG